MYYVLAAPDDSRTLELGCGNLYDDFGGNVNDCDQDEIFENHFEVCVCDYMNCNGESTRETPFTAMVAFTALAATLRSTGQSIN